MSKYEQLVPAETRDFIDGLVEKVRENLERDGYIETVAFAGHFDGRLTIIPNIARLPKDVSSKLIRKIAGKVEADYALFVDEAWTLEATSKTEVDLLREQYGEVRNMPNRIDVVMFSLQTHAAQFLGMPKRITIDEAKKRYTFGAVEFEMMDGAEGRFVGLLPPKGSKQ